MPTKVVVAAIALALAVCFALFLAVRLLGVPYEAKIMVCLHNGSGQVLNDVVVTWPSGNEELERLPSVPSMDSYQCLNSRLPATTASVSFRAANGNPGRIDSLEITGIHSSVIHINNDFQASVTNHTSPSP